MIAAESWTCGAQVVGGFRVLVRHWSQPKAELPRAVVRPGDQVQR